MMGTVQLHHLPKASFALPPLPTLLPPPPERPLPRRQQPPPDRLVIHFHPRRSRCRLARSDQNPHSVHRCKAPALAYALSQACARRWVWLSPRWTNGRATSARPNCRSRWCLFTSAFISGRWPGNRKVLGTTGKNKFQSLTSAELWTLLQADYDLRLARHAKTRAVECDVAPLAVLQPAMAPPCPSVCGLGFSFVRTENIVQQ